MRKNIRHLLATFGLVGLLSCPENNSSSPVHTAQQQENTESQARELIDILKSRVVKGNYTTEPPVAIDNISYKTYVDRVEIGNQLYDIFYQEIYDEKVQKLGLVKSRIENTFYLGEIPVFALRSPADYPDFPPSYLPTFDVFIFDEGIKGKCFPPVQRTIYPRLWPNQKTCDADYNKMLDEILPVYRNMARKK